MNLFVFGFGYSAAAFRAALPRPFDDDRRHGHVVRKGRGAAGARASRPRVFDGRERADPRHRRTTSPAPSASWSRSRRTPRAIPALRALRATRSRPRRASRWIGYLSTVGVYGDHGGAWVDEDDAAAPGRAPARARRVAAETAWLDLGAGAGKAVQVFRLAGIYGPGRNALVNLAEGTARRIVKPGQVFNRIHVEDIAAVLAASIERPRAGAIYNVTDDEPAPPQDVVAYAAGLAGVAPPPEIAFEDARLSRDGGELLGREQARLATGASRTSSASRCAIRPIREGTCGRSEPQAKGGVPVRPRGGSRPARNGRCSAG